uniref:TNFR-Cys domain-containing protein n=1 Tax=Arion vulgaris TaxID=1028688 RepID=A0A0B7BDB5_9EUPU
MLPLTVLTLVVMSCTAEAERICPKGYWMRRTSVGEIRCDLCIDGVNYISENDHQKRECNSCSKIQNSTLEILVKACYRDADAVIICLSGYYRENGVCKHCSVCEHEIRPCQDYSDAICCSDKDDKRKICNITNKSTPAGASTVEPHAASASTEEPHGHCSPSLNWTDICKTDSFDQAKCKNCCPLVYAEKFFNGHSITRTCEEEISSSVSWFVYAIVIVTILHFFVYLMSIVNIAVWPWLMKKQAKIDSIMYWLSIIFPLLISGLSMSIFWVTSSMSIFGKVYAAFVGVYAVCYLIWSKYRFIQDGGDKNKSQDVDAATKLMEQEKENK